MEEKRENSRRSFIGKTALGTMATIGAANLLLSCGGPGNKNSAKSDSATAAGVALQEGDNNWPVIVKALDEVGYQNFATIEQPGGDSPEGLKDLCNRLTNILKIES